MIDAALRKEEMIRASLARSTDGVGFDALVQDVLSGRCIVLEGNSSIMVLENTPSALNGWIVGGDFLEVMSILPGAEALARAMGKKYATFQKGRKAWQRVMSKYGYAWNGVEFRKAL